MHSTYPSSRSLLIAIVIWCCALPAGVGPVAAEPSPHMISAANPLAAEAGREMLRKGGSAVDAAIAAQLVLTLVEPQSSGIGGGAFLLHYDGNSEDVTAYDGRESAPAAIKPGVFLDKNGKPRRFFDAVVGGLSVGVPGVLRMLEAAHKAHGKLPWADLFAPAIRLSDEGFAVSPRLHKLIARDKHLKTSASTAAYFFDKKGKPLAVGSKLRNPALAETLRAIAAGGADAFYNGAIAQGIVAAVRTATRNPGLMVLEDLAKYEAKVRSPLCRPYRQWQVCTMPPPTSGGLATLQILGILEFFDLAALEPGSREAIHLISEASRLAYADRARYAADADFVAVPLKGLLDRSYLQDRASLISTEGSVGKATAGTPPAEEGRSWADDASLELPSTSHLSVVDSAGNAVSMTTSIENVFGSRLMTGGFLLNNQLTDFSFLPEIDGRPVANRVEPGKRPRSSMSPTLVLDADDELVLAVGSPGGSRIIGYVVQTVVAVLDWGLDMQAAIDQPRHVNRNGPLALEKGTVLEELAADLRALGHEVTIRPLTSGLHGIRITEKDLDGGADPRREGVALGD